MGIWLKALGGTKMAAVVINNCVQSPQVVGSPSPTVGHRGLQFTASNPPPPNFKNRFLTLARLLVVAVGVLKFGGGSYFVSCP